MSFSTAFQSNAFQNNAFQIATGVVVTPPPSEQTGGGGGYIGGIWSRGQWRTLVGEIESERRHLLDIQRKKRRETELRAAAAKQAEHDAFVARLDQAEAQTAQILRSLALEHAQQTANQATIAQRMAEQHATQQEFVRQMMDDEDEEAFALLENDD